MQLQLEVKAVRQKLCDKEDEIDLLRNHYMRTNDKVEILLLRVSQLKDDVKLFRDQYVKKEEELIKTRLDFPSTWNKR